MDNIIETLDKKIAKATEELSVETREAINASNWKSTLLTMNNKFNQDQIEKIEIETELLLCGITNTKDYPKELENRLKISSVEVSLLLGELDKNIFKKIQKELENRIVGNELIIKKEKPPIIDPIFSNIPSDTREAIARSGWKEKLYKIGQKYNLNIYKLGLLEEVTTNILTGKISALQYENEIRTKELISSDKIQEFISEINEFVFKNIKEIMVNNPHIEDKIEEEVPLPPYKKEKIVEIPISINNETIEQKEDFGIFKDGTINLDEMNKINNKDDILIKNKPGVDIYRESGIEIISTEENVPVKKIELEHNYREGNIAPEIKYETVDIDEEVLNKSNIISDKLFNKTASQNVVTDYSLPKINPQTQSMNNIQGGGIPAKPHDPYHEQI